MENTRLRRLLKCSHASKPPLAMNMPQEQEQATAAAQKQAAAAKVAQQTATAR